MEGRGRRKGGKRRHGVREMSSREEVGRGGKEVGEEEGGRPKRRGGKEKEGERVCFNYLLINSIKAIFFKYDNKEIFINLKIKVYKVIDFLKN